LERLKLEQAEEMTASEICKYYGLATLGEAGTLSGKSTSTLQKWRTNQLPFFLFVVEGAVSRKLELLKPVVLVRKK
tara:strand:+ start:208 stop:435 length:228 start_codon:yes stop_codon:yes gene_type:complete